MFGIIIAFCVFDNKDFIGSKLFVTVLHGCRIAN